MKTYNLYNRGADHRWRCATDERVDEECGQALDAIYVLAETEYEKTERSFRQMTDREFLARFEENNV